MTPDNPSCRHASRNESSCVGSSHISTSTLWMSQNSWSSWSANQDSRMKISRCVLQWGHPKPSRLMKGATVCIFTWTLYRYVISTQTPSTPSYSVIYLFTSLIHFSLRLLRFVPHCLLHVLSPGINKGLSDLKVAPQSDRSCLITSVTSTQSQTFNLYVNGSYLTRTQSTGNEQFAQPIGKLVTGNIPVTRVTISLLEKWLSDHPLTAGWAPEI